MRDYRFFVYMLNSSSRRALYTGMTRTLIGRVNEHRSLTDKQSFAARYRTFRLVYYEEFADVNLCIRREKEIKGWSRAKKNALVAALNPQWRDLLREWEEKYKLDFVVQIPEYRPTSNPKAKANPKATATARSFASASADAQDDNA